MTLLTSGTFSMLRMNTLVENSFTARVQGKVLVHMNKSSSGFVTNWI